MVTSVPHEMPDRPFVLSSMDQQVPACKRAADPGQPWCGVVFPIPSRALHSLPRYPLSQAGLRWAGAAAFGPNYRPAYASPGSSDLLECQARRCFRGGYCLQWSAQWMSSGGGTRTLYELISLGALLQMLPETISSLLPLQLQLFGLQRPRQRCCQHGKGNATEQNVRTAQHWCQAGCVGSSDLEHPDDAAGASQASCGARRARLGSRQHRS
jgi:hypothetical protein